MAQHEYIIENGSGSAVRADINTLLQAVVSHNSGSTAPSITYAYQLWADTDTGKLKLRNGTNNAWDEVGLLDTANLGMLLKSVFPYVTTTVNATTAQLNFLSGASISVAANKCVIADSNKDIDLDTGDFKGTDAVLKGDITTTVGAFATGTTTPKAEFDAGNQLDGYPTIMSRGKTENELDFAVPDSKDMFFGEHDDAVWEGGGDTKGGTKRMTLEADGDLTLNVAGAKFRGDGSALTNIEKPHGTFSFSGNGTVTVPNGVDRMVMSGVGSGGDGQNLNYGGDGGGAIGINLVVAAGDTIVISGCLIDDTSVVVKRNGVTKITFNKGGTADGTVTGSGTGGAPFNPWPQGFSGSRTLGSAGASTNSSGSTQGGQGFAVIDGFYKT